MRFQSFSYLVGYQQVVQIHYHMILPVDLYTVIAKYIISMETEHNNKIQFHDYHFWFGVVD